MQGSRVDCPRLMKLTVKHRYFKNVHSEFPQQNLSILTTGVDKNHYKLESDVDGFPIACAQERYRRVLREFHL